MNFDEFLKEKEKIEKLSIEEQKKFYEQLLKNKHDKTELYVYASFYYGHLFYQNGNFGKVIEIMEPIVMDYQSYPYTPKILSCFNLIGVAAHCEAEYSISRFFYKIALKIAKENSAKFYYAFEYNNIALTYIAEQNYTEAIRNLEFAEDVLKDCDEEMGAYIYINKSISLQKLNRLTEALQAYEIGINQYHADKIVPDDAIRCAATLYYRLGKMDKYKEYKQQILLKIRDMHAAEFMDACKELFECGMDSDDDELMTTILRSMDWYIEKYTNEIKVGLVFSELKYEYAVKKSDKDAVLDALEKKNDYKDRIIKHSIEKRLKSLEQHIEINSQISDLELDALTGFRNRKAYYKDINMIEQDTKMLGLVSATDETTLLETLARWILDHTEKQTAFAANFPFMRIAAANRVVTSSMFTNMATGALVFVPGANYPVMVAAQIGMMIQLASIFGKPLSFDRVYDAAGILASGLGVRAITRQLCRSTGHYAFAVKAVMAAGGTYAMGRALCSLYESNIDYSRANDAVSSFVSFVKRNLSTKDAQQDAVDMTA